MHLPTDGGVAQPVGGEQHHAAALHQPLRRGQLASRLLKVLTLGVGQDNRHGTWTRHGSLLKQADLPIPQAPKNPSLSV
jgi:hypothetical protein